MSVFSLLLSIPGLAAALFSQRPCPKDLHLVFLETAQYYLAAEVALHGVGLWVQENPTDLDDYYLAARDPGKQAGSVLGKAAVAAYQGRAEDPRIRSYLLHPKWRGATTDQEQGWTVFLNEQDPAVRLTALKRVDFRELHVLVGGKAALEPWLYAVLKRETGEMLEQLAATFDEKDAVYPLALAVTGVHAPQSAEKLRRMLEKEAVPHAIQSDNGLKQKVLELHELDRIPYEETQTFFVVTDAAGNDYQLLKGERPHPVRPAKADAKQMLQWRREVAAPFQRSVDFWMAQLVVRLFAIKEFPSLNRLLVHQTPMTTGRGNCAYRPGVTMAVLRYGADILRPEGHYRERNFLKENKFNAVWLLFQLEIEPTSGGTKY